MTTARLSAERALPLLRAAVDADPRHLESRRRLARALLRSGRLAELVEWCTPATDDPVLLHVLGNAASLLGHDALALEALERACAAGHDASHGYLAEVLLRRGRADEAEEAARRGIAVSARDSKSQSTLANVLLARGERERLWDVCAALRERGASGGYVPSAMAHAARSSAQREEVARLVGEWPRLTVLDGLANDRLRDELLGHPALRALPGTHSTTGTGARLDRLQDDPGPLTRALLERIGAEVERAGTARPVLNAWAVATRYEGHEEWHIHPAAQMSGVYYVAVPEAGDDARAGSIEFGPMPLGTSAEPDAWPRRRFRPQAGRLLLFPSFYGHRTWPTGSNETRLVVAFDAMPAEPR